MTRRTKERRERSKINERKVGDEEKGRIRMR
jgi:hypothetical protein